MKEYAGLSGLRSVSGSGLYCPKCGNYLDVVMNGFFHGELLFCPKEEKVFAVNLIDVTKKAGKQYIGQCKEDMAVEEVRRKVNRNNYKTVKL